MTQVPVQPSAAQAVKAVDQYFDGVKTRSRSWTIIVGAIKMLSRMASGCAVAFRYRLVVLG